MESCKGFGDWLACLKCPIICTKMCPIENENVIEELKQRIRMLESSVKQAGIPLEGNRFQR